jgi:hypothetical protein
MNILNCIFLACSSVERNDEISFFNVKIFKSYRLLLKTKMISKKFLF